MERKSFAEIALPVWKDHYQFRLAMAQSSPAPHFQEMWARTLAEAKAEIEMLEATITVETRFKIRPPRL